jgi:hypothetical protein
MFCSNSGISMNAVNKKEKMCNEVMNDLNPFHHNENKMLSLI